MAGINLSQSLQEKEAQARGSFFDTGFYINLAILLVVVATFGGVRWYLSTLNDEIVRLDTDIAAKSMQLRGKEVDRVADLRERLDAVSENLQTIPRPADLFARMEAATIPSVQLTRYEEKWSDNQVYLSGITENLKFVALEMLSLKKISEFEKVAVSQLQYNKEGKLEFTLIITTSPHQVAP